MSSRTAAGCGWTCSMRPPVDRTSMSSTRTHTGSTSSIFARAASNGSSPGPTSAAGSEPGRRRPSPPKRRAHRCRSTRSCSTSSSFTSSGTGSGRSRRRGMKTGTIAGRHLRPGGPVRRQHPPRISRPSAASRLLQGIAHERGLLLRPRAGRGRVGQHRQVPDPRSRPIPEQIDRGHDARFNGRGRPAHRA